jgi:hypothetical protein
MLDFKISVRTDSKEVSVKNTLKFVLACVVILAVVAGPLSAQNRRGLRFGYIDSKLDRGGEGVYAEGYSSFYVGFFNDQRIIPMIWFSSGLDYYQTGSKADDKNKLVLHWLSVPLALKLKLGPFRGFGGVHGALRVSSKLTLLGEDLGAAKDFGSWDAGAFLGGGIQILFVAAEFKYNWGLTDLHNGYKNNFWQAGLTLSF